MWYIGINLSIYFLTMNVHLIGINWFVSRVDDNKFTKINGTRLGLAKMLVTHGSIMTRA